MKAWPLVLLRIYIGYFFLDAGVGKIVKGFLKSPEILKGIVEKDIAQKPAQFYADFLANTVIPNIEIFNILVVAGESLVGFCLLLGIFSRGAALVMLFLNINFYFACGPSAAYLNQSFIIIAAVLFLAAPGRFVGIDSLINKKFPRFIFS